MFVLMLYIGILLQNAYKDLINATSKPGIFMYKHVGTATTVHYHRKEITRRRLNVKFQNLSTGKLNVL